MTWVVTATLMFLAILQSPSPAQQPTSDVIAEPLTFSCPVD